MTVCRGGHALRIRNLIHIHIRKTTWAPSIRIGCTCWAVAGLATGDRIFVTGRDTVSKCVLRSCACFCSFWFQGIQSCCGRAPEAQNVRHFPLEFWCSEGHFAQFHLIWTLFWPILTCFDLSCRADLTYFHLFWPIRRADLTYFHLFRPISFHTKAPWTGHLIFFVIQTKKNSSHRRAILWRTFWEVFGGSGGNFQKFPPNFSEVAFMWKSPDAKHFGATS